MGVNGHKALYYQGAGPWDMSNLSTKYSHLQKIIRPLKRVTVAFSGGVDSSLLAKVSKDLLSTNAIAVTVAHDFFPSGEFENAREIAREIGIQHFIVQLHQLRSPKFHSNPSQRCYYCKKNLFHLLKKFDAPILEGTDCSEIAQDRPGLQASRENQVLTPFLKAGLTKPEVRKLAHLLHLSNYNRPAQSCLATRIPYGEKITSQKLKRIDQAEQYLKSLGFNPVRVRTDNNSARIECSKMKRLSTKIINHFNTLGFTQITLATKFHKITRNL